MNKYQGKWYQIKAIPKWFQQGCNNSVAEYQLKDGVLQVKNSCVEDGQTKTIKGKAYPVNKGKSKLEVDFVGGRIFTGDYWVLNTDYNTALVGSPDKNSLWILSRKKTITKKKLQQLEDIAKKQGFDIKRLKR